MGFTGGGVRERHEFGRTTLGRHPIDPAVRRVPEVDQVVLGPVRAAHAATDVRAGPRSPARQVHRLEHAFLEEAQAPTVGREERGARTVGSWHCPPREFVQPADEDGETIRPGREEREDLAIPTERD